MIRVDQLLRGLQYLLLPPHCLACGADGAPQQDLCAGCEADLPGNAQACRRCALPLPREEPLCGACLVHPPAFSAAFVPFRYEWPLDKLIMRFKFNGSLAAGRVLAAMLVKALREQQVALPDVLVPVPLHPSRLRERGFNQAQELATPLARALGLRLAPRLLSRVRATPAQAELSAKARRKNLQEAFRARNVSGLRVAILDDVWTTGSTMEACAETLLAAGASEVAAWALARAPAPGSDVQSA